jgi:hypothetical protein
MHSPSPIHIRLARIAGGSTLVLIGLIGLFVPVMPGWLFLVPGLALLAKDFVWAERLNDRVRHRLRAARQTLPLASDSEIESEGDEAIA